MVDFADSDNYMQRKTVYAHLIIIMESFNALMGGFKISMRGTMRHLIRLCD